MYIFSLLKYYKKEAVELLAYLKENRVKFIASAEKPKSTIYIYLRKIFGAEKVELDGSTPFDKTIMLVFEIFNKANLNTFETAKKQFPYIPCILIVRNYDGLDIDDLYERGADYIVYEEYDNIEKNYKNPVNSKETLKELLSVLSSLILKYYIYEFYWQHINKIKLTDFQKIHRQYANENNINITFTSILSILHNVFGHVRKPHTQFEKKFDKNVGSFVFLALWSVFNELIALVVDSLEASNSNTARLDKSSPNPNYRKKEYYCLKTKNHSEIYYTFSNEIYSDDLKLFLNSYLPEMFYFDKRINDFRFGEMIRGKYGYPVAVITDKKEIETRPRSCYPRELIPVLLRRILGPCDKKELNVLFAEFNVFNILRNNLFLTHGSLSNLCINYNYYINLCSIRLLNLIFVLLTGSFIEKSKIDFIFYIQKNYLENRMRIRGNFEALNNIDGTFTISYKDELRKEEQKASISIPRRNNELQELVEKLKKGTKIEIFVSIDYQEENKRQFLKLVDIIEL